VSQIELTSLVVYRRPSSSFGSPECLYGGGQGGGPRPDGRPGFAFNPSSVPLPGNPRPALANGVLAFFFASTDLPKTIRHWFLTAQKLGAELHPASVVFEVGDQKIGVIDEEEFGLYKFANVRRMTSASQNMLLERLLAKSGSFSAEPEWTGPVALARLRAIGDRIDGVAELLGTVPKAVEATKVTKAAKASKATDEEPTTRYHLLDVIVVPVWDDGVMTQIALVKPTLRPVRIEQNMDRDVLVWPPATPQRRRIFDSDKD
jgi:hypothetical protein